MLNNEIEEKGSRIPVPHLFVQSGHQDFLQLTMLICTCWKGVPKIPSEIREYKVVTVLCVYVPHPWYVLSVPLTELRRT